MPKRKGPDDNDGPTPHGRGGDPDNVSAAEEHLAAKAAQGRAGSGERRSGPDDSAAIETAGIDPTAARAFVDNITENPRSLVGRSAEDIADHFTAAGFPASTVRTQRRGTSGNAVQVRIHNHPEITNIQVHPGGGRHTPEGSPYWKISTSTAGKTWVVPGNFRGADELGGKVVRYDE
ncbi:hypothetical protein SAMN05421748_104312 [Paractinoplanes atraurantiacus]|uniref:Uncharacterized protein n=2 Tax=Paractinoplanes atraurantiacus TaxID=1036182 RepID=A0A285HG21_9ACTN|nr:hypothetical protein SAMN05421748_104312 [Actinoplanes atraurantiacus]